MDSSGKTNVILVAIVVIAAVVVIAAFVMTQPAAPVTTTTTKPTTTTTTTTQKPLTKVTLVLGWLADAEFAGQYVALGKGYYSEVGLDVTIIPSNGTTIAAQMVGVGKAEFGVSSAAAVVVGRNSGVPVVSVAMLDIHNPISFFFLDPTLKDPQKWVGKKVGIQPTSSTSIIYSVLMQKLGIDRSKINEIPTGYDAIGPLSTGQLDVYPDFDVWITKYKAQLPNIDFVRASSFGVDMYNHCLVANSVYLKDHPDIVRAFVQASLKGWIYAKANPVEAIDLLVKYVPDLNKTSESSVLANEFSGPKSWPDFNKIGAQDNAGWNNAQDLLFQYKFITRKMVDVSEAFTNQFLP